MTANTREGAFAAEPSPLASCIMPTCNRRQFIARAVHCFQAQQYPRIELVVLDDGSDPIGDLLPPDPRIRYRRLPARRSIGAKRNEACALARGEIIVHWDDDDWYPSWRLTRQLAPLLDGTADLSGSSVLYYHDEKRARAYRYDGSRSPLRWLGPLAYFRRVWEAHPFPDISVSEDIRFLAQVAPARCRDLREPALCVAAIHGSNASPKRVAGAFWNAEPLASVQALYAERAGPAPAPGERHEGPAANVPSGDPGCTRSPAAERPEWKPSCLVGIHLHSDPARLQRTLDAVQTNTAPGVDVVLLPDGPDGATRSALRRLPFVQDATDEPRGAAACFNRLARRGREDVIVLLESGSEPAPGWLDRLVAALRDPRNGLAGPSTNLAWNEQAAFAGASGGTAAVARVGAEAARRFGDAVQSLAPLHSLCDFCFAVRRDVIDAVGAADEGYGLGPCWEMDYAARAAMASFRDVWVGGAYVFRGPLTARRIREESRRFEANRRRYQDRFCGRRLRRETAGYDDHCTGEACPDFCPAGLVQVKLPLGAASPAQPAPPTVRAVSASRATNRVAGAQPLVSCVMPTRDRARFIPLAMACFDSQDWPEREMIVVDDGVERIEHLVAAHPRARYLRCERSTIGAKRELGARAAAGEIIVQWDDDDWYAPDRIRRQAVPLAEGLADVTGLALLYVLEVQPGVLWEARPDVVRRLCAQSIAAGTLAFRRTTLRPGVTYPDIDVGEDVTFLQRAVAAGRRLKRLDVPGLFVCVRHGRNTWHFVPGRSLGKSGWRRVQLEETRLPSDLVHRYQDALRPDGAARRSA